MSIQSKPLLLAVDGSERALQTVQYAATETAFGQMPIVLFHVFNRVPETYYDLEREPKSVKVVRQVRSWEAQQKKEITAYMQEARKLLLDAGRSASDVSIKIRDRKRGVARDIIAEAQHGYHAVMLRRRGTTALKNIVVGSVTNKLMEKLEFIPILLAGTRPANKRVLVGVDGSPCSDRAVRFVAERIAPLADCRVRLVHVVRNGSLPDPFNGNGLIDSAAIFTKASAILTAAGVAEHQISTQSITGALSRAGAIVAAAEKGKWGTIVVGRQGLSRPRDFFMGRVSNKVVHAGRRNTVWILN